MKKRLKALISIILTLTLLMSSITVFNANAAVYYDRTAAVNYAKNHWNDGVGLCAQFVSACISAGGLSVSQNVCLNLWNTLKNYGTPYKLTSTNSSGNGNIKLSANTGKVEAGDPLFYVCETCGGTSGKSAFPHVVFCGGTDSSGYLTAYAHNSAWNNKKVWTQLNSSAHSGHTFSVYSIHINGTSGYTMSYNANGGSGAPATQTGSTTYTISSDIPERFGYTFEGWTPNDEGWLYYAGSTITLTQNTTLYAYWKNDLNYYDYGNGVVGAGDSDIIRYAGQDIYYKFVPQSSGYYIFESYMTDDGLDTKGWLYDANGNELAYNDDGNRESNLIKKTDFRFIYNVTAGKTYYIKIRSWGGQTGDYMFDVYADKDLIFNANGGSGAPATQVGEFAYTIPSTKPIRNGYTFLGWSTKKNASTAQYHAGDYLELDSDTTLYAIWKANTLKVYFNANGGKVSSDNHKIVSDSIYYSSDSTKVYETWTYNNPRANGLTNAKTFGLSRDGYTFVGWGTTASGGTIFDQNNTALVPSEITSNINNGDCEITLYAIWQKNTPTTYTLSYSANGGSGAPSSQSGATSYTISSTQPTRSGYTFLGWSKSIDATTASYRASDSITLTANTTLYAVWEISSKPELYISTNEVKLRIGKSAIVVCDFDDTKYNLSLSASIGDPTIASIDWSDTGAYELLITGKFEATTHITIEIIDSVTEVVYDSEIVKVTVDHNIPSSYVLSYTANGGIGAPASQSGATSYTVSSTQPTRSGYTFLGWSKSSGATTASYKAGDSITLTANTTLYAVWEKNAVVPTPAELPEIKINNTTTTAINYGDTLVLQLKEIEIPERYAVEWFVEGAGVSTKVNADGTECRVTSIANGSVTITGKLVDEKGEPVTNADGEEIFDQITLTSKAGFWQKLVSFFKNLFGANRIIY